MIDTVAVAVALSLTLSGGYRAARDVARRSPVERAPERERVPETEAPGATGARADDRRAALVRGSDAPRAPRSVGAPTAPAGPLRTAPTATARPSAGGGGTPTESPFYYDIRIFGGANGTTTGYREDFLAYPADPSQPRPLLVVFHRFGVGYLDAWIHTQYFQEARLRGWNVLAPLSASGVHFGSIEGQINTEKAMEWVLSNFNIDKARIYAVGFSMGGGAAANFAARHLDPDQFMFAAVADHTGSVSLPNVYFETAAATQAILDFWFGNGQPGSAEPWKMLRSSLLDFDPVTLQVDPATDLARNLRHVPVKVWRASNEPAPTAYLSGQCDVLVSHLQSLGGQVESEIVPYYAHEWSLLDESEALGWLSQHTLQLPTAGRTLADQDGVYFHFELTQDVAGAFTPFSWDLEPPEPNRLELHGTANLRSLKVDVLGAALDPSSFLTLELSTADGLGDEVTLSPWPAVPSAVFRDGLQVFQNWTYDDLSGELTIQELDGAQTHLWGVQP